MTTGPVPPGRPCVLCSAPAPAGVPGHPDLRRCGACGLVFAVEARGAAGRDLYGQAYGRGGAYDFYFEVGRRAPRSDNVPWPMRRFLADVAPAGRLLDVGASTGRFLVAAQRSGWEVEGVEIAAAAAAAAAAVSGARVTAGSLRDVDGTGFAAVTAWEVLEHVADPAGLVREARRRLAPGGVLALSVPSWESPWTRRSSDPSHWPPFHLTFWSEAPLRFLLTRAGFASVTIRHKPFAWGEELGRWRWPLLPLSLLRAWLLRQRGMHLLAVARET